MKHKIKIPTYTEISIPDGYYQFAEEVFCVRGEEIVNVFVSDNYAAITTRVSEYSMLPEASLTTKDVFDAELEKAFEIIRGKL